MKKLNSKGFTLIELLAVVTIMGILMLVAIPAISRTIENTRKDTFLDTAKQYVNGLKTMWISDSLECQETVGGTNYVLASALSDGDYYVYIDSSKTSGIGAGTNYPILLQEGGKSSWGKKEVKGYIKISVSGAGTVSAKQQYYIALGDGTHGIKDDNITTEYSQLKRGQVELSGVTAAEVTAPSGIKLCKEV